MKIVITIVTCVVWFGQSALSQAAIPALQSSGLKVFAAVLSGQVNNSVGLKRTVGAHVRAEGDTAWTVVPNSNTLSFGVGFSQLNGSRRYYVCGGNGLFRTENDGASWRMLTNWTTMEVLAVAVDPVNPMIIYISTPWGVFRSIDDGATWHESIRGMKKWYVQHVVIDNTNPMHLYAAAEDDVYRSRNRGDWWTPLRVGVKEVRTVMQHPRKVLALFVGCEDEGIRTTTDGGKTWTTAAGTQGHTFLTFAASKDGKQLYAAGWKTGVWASSDDGRTWMRISDALHIEEAYSLCVHPSDPAHVYLGSRGDGLLESLDGGITWKKTALDGSQVTHVAIYP